jgi:hypothetical protein
VFLRHGSAIFAGCDRWRIDVVDFGFGGAPATADVVPIFPGNSTRHEQDAKRGHGVTGVVFKLAATQDPDIEGSRLPVQVCPEWTRKS